MSSVLGTPRSANTQRERVRWQDHLAFYTVLLLADPTHSPQLRYVAVRNAASFAEREEAHVGAEIAVEQHLHEHDTVAVVLVETRCATEGSRWRSRALAVHDLTALRELDALTAMLSRLA